jgi:excisionase family DNA binding protein
MPKEAENNAKTLTVAEAGAQYFGLCPRSSYAAVKRGQIPVIKIGRLLRVPVVALERMLEQAGIAKGDTTA